MLPQWVIEKKRDGHILDEDEIRYFINGYTKGEIPDYQMSALAMAIFFRSMTLDEMAILTDAMMNSGDVVDTSGIHAPKVDKHSTGGIGDKTSLILAPLVACCDVAVPMISGRGLGITGGTLDKLESIPGYRTNLSDKEFLAIVDTVGCSITGQTGQLAPADKKLYALRDVTATVPSIPLIVASIMCKKLAEGIDGLVLDVKWGKGAFMKTVEQAQELARNMVEVGSRMNKGMAALITDMNQPLGHAAGNALEVAECVKCLQGEGPEDLMELTMTLAARMLILASRASEHVEALGILRGHIQSGKALEVFKKMVKMHGGDVRALEDPRKLPAARIREEVPSPRDGYVAAVDAEGVGRGCVVLGAGRTKTEDKVDFGVGVSGIVKIGERVEKGQPLATIHANDERRLAEARQMIQPSFKIVDEPQLAQTMVTDMILPGSSRG